MHGATRGVALFLAGTIFGAGLMTSLAAQSTLNTGLRLNHVGISVPNFQETVTFYEKVMGFRVSHRFAPNPDLQPETTISAEVGVSTRSESASGATARVVG